MVATIDRNEVSISKCLEQGIIVIRGWIVVVGACLVPCRIFSDILTLYS